MFNIDGQQISQHSEHRHRSAHVLHVDVGDQPGSIARIPLSTGYEPKLIQPQSNPKFISTADGEDEDLMTVENGSARTSSIFTSA